MTQSLREMNVKRAFSWDVYKEDAKLEEIQKEELRFVCERCAPAMYKGVDGYAAIHTRFERRDEN